ncbi:hypothetical protein [Actinomyces ruminis]|uniref:hypothetical protein n=1 Tax=Actinomyces ruminis TaxID=1937003 RepID=UPI00211F3C3A|nr:hypothetical protein [Actinomyces ruminis]
MALAANVLGAFGVRDRGEKEQQRAAAAAKRASRLGRDQLAEQADNGADQAAIPAGEPATEVAEA